MVTMKKKEQTIVTLTAEVAVTETENGLDCVQVLPENPRVGLVKPFSGWGRGQMLSNGSFDFVHKPRKRRKPDYKEGHVSLSFGDDGLDRVIFVLPNGQRDELSTLLPKEIRKVVAYLKKRGL
jgi:hypothetical protein